MKWQPIRTAPRDGSVILITDGNCACAAFYDEGVPEAPWFIADTAVSYREDMPTHWMHLPESPFARRDSDDSVDDQRMEAYWDKWAATQDHRAAVEAYLTA